MRSRWRTVTYRVGVALLALGIYLLGFVIYELVWSDYAETSAQRSFVAEIRHFYPHTMARALNETAVHLPTGQPVSLPELGRFRGGAPIGVIEIPSIHLRQVIVEGIDVGQLRVGPGHYPSTPRLGSFGNVALAGHRTTWGHPFRQLNELRRGDAIVITTDRGRFLYRVTRVDVVAPTDVAVLDPTRTPTLTLTTCNPPYSAATRLVVVSELAAVDRFASVTPVTAPGAPATTPSTSHTIDGSSGGGGWWPVAFRLTVLTLLVSLGWRWRQVSREPKLVTMFGVILFIPLLISTYSALSWVLPAGY